MIIERTRYIPKSGKTDEVLKTRHQACEVRLSLGLSAGIVFTEDTDAGTVIHWSCRFSSTAEHQNDLTARDQSPAFEAVRQQMGQLIDDFERRFLTLAPQPGSVITDQALRGLPIVPEEHSFESHGRQLKGYLFRPPGDRTFPCLVFNHGSGIVQGSDDVCRPGIALLLMGWGLAVFMPHRRGYGNSPGTPWQEEVGAAFGTPEYDRKLVPRLQGEADDVVAAYHYVRSLPGIETDHIGVMGSSFGGITTLLAAAREPGFNCAVEFAGAAMNWETAPTLRRFLLAEAEKLTRPIFFAQAENDFNTRPTTELAQAARRSNPAVHEKIYPPFGLTSMEGHYLCGQGGSVWQDDVRWFLERYL
jgi:dienelactone hydrolase